MCKRITLCRFDLPESAQSSTTQTACNVVQLKGNETLFKRTPAPALQHPRDMALVKALGIAELLDNILRLCDERTLMNCQRVNQTFKSAIDGSHQLQYQLFFTDQPPLSLSPITTEFDVNPLVAKLLPQHADREYPHILLLDTFIAPPTDDSDPSYYLLHPNGSWKRMLLFRHPEHAYVYIDFHQAKTKFSTRMATTKSKRMSSVVKNPVLRWRAWISGIVDLLDEKVEEVAAGRCAIWDEAEFEDWILNILSDYSLKIDRWQKSEDSRLVRSFAATAWTQAAASIATRARCLAFNCAVESLEGRQGQHYGDVDEFVRKIRAEPDLLTISDAKVRHRKWSIAATGSA